MRKCSKAKYAKIILIFFIAQAPDTGLSWMHTGLVADGYFIYLMGGEFRQYSYIRWMDTRTEVWNKFLTDCNPLIFF